MSFQDFVSKDVALEKYDLTRRDEEIVDYIQAYEQKTWQMYGLMSVRTAKRLNSKSVRMRRFRMMGSYTKLSGLPLH